MNFFMEVAKLRAARALWSRLVRQFEPQNPKSLSLRTHSQTSGWSLTAQDVFNNVGRTCIEAMAATQGHTQSLHTNALDEAIALPTDFSARIARNTQLLLQQESGTTHTIDPWAGSYYVEQLTHDLAERAWAHIQEAEEAGGMAAAIEQGIPKMRIEEAAARTQARIDSGQQRVIGVNTYRLAAEDKLDVLRVDNDDVYRQQMAKLERLRAERDDDDVDRGARGPHRAPRGRGAARDGNLLELARRRRPRQGHGRRDLRRAREGLRASPGRDPYDLRRVPRRVGRRRAARSSTRCSTATAEFEEAEGRRPRILVAKMGQDGHDRGQKVIVSAFADMGFDVDVGPLFSTPEEVAQQAVDADVHIVGVSSLAAGHLALLPALKTALAEQGRDDIMVVIGGVIPPDDVPDAEGDGRGRGVPARHRHRRVGARPARQAARRSWSRTVIEGSGARTRARSSSLAASTRAGRPRTSTRRSVEGVRAGRRAAVARAITLVESAKREHREAARELLTRLTEADDAGVHSPAVRVGISGVPGVGKSTFIEALGTRLTAAGHRVGVLAVDPSSVRTGGSVLGDKTRMSRLSADPDAYIRPSPSAGTLGGVARATTQAMAVLEAAGYDVVLVETVGVGQSEVTVAGMVDTFLFLTLARTGDQLQGIKKGILEIADVIAVNKADGDREQRGEGRRPRARRRAAPGARARRVGAAGGDRARRSTTAASTTSGSACSPTASTSAPTAWPASGPSSSSTSPGRWCATSSSSGSATRPACAPCATRSAPPSSPASCPPRWRPTGSSPPTTTAGPAGVGVPIGRDTGPDDRDDHLDPWSVGWFWAERGALAPGSGSDGGHPHDPSPVHDERHPMSRSHRGRTRTRAALAGVTVAAACAAALGSVPAEAAPAGGNERPVISGGLITPLSLDVQRNGAVLVSQNFAGQLLRKAPGRPHRVIARANGEIGAVSVADGVVTYGVSRGDNEVGLIRQIRNGRDRLVADLGAVERRVNPDRAVTYGFLNLGPSLPGRSPSRPGALHAASPETHPYATTSNARHHLRGRRRRQRDLRDRPARPGPRGRPRSRASPRRSRPRPRSSGSSPPAPSASGTASSRCPPTSRWAPAAGST